MIFDAENGLEKIIILKCVQQVMIENDHKMETTEDRATWIITWTHFSRRTTAQIWFTVCQYQQTFGL